mgnify:FL=1|jgi:hypothetical protein|tara:strand:- start:709 stop:1212 length:504 start_codon:yes stop_codon:yes gene_type:complete
MINFKILKNYDVSSGITLLIISLFLLFEIRLAEFSDISTGEGAIGPKSAPTYLNITIILLSILLIFNSFFNKNIINNNSKFNSSLVFKKAQLIAAAFLYLFLTDLVGYLLSTFIIIPLLLFIFQNKNFKKNLFISFVGTLIYYIFFIKILGLHNPDPQIEFFEVLSF